jgi:hypothetical protein
MSRRSIVLVIATVMSTAVPDAAAVAEPEIRVIIRTYGTAAGSGDPVPALAEASALLEAAGVGVTWVRCETAFVRPDEDQCLAPLAVNELVIRFVRHPPHHAQHSLVTLGDSLIDTHLRVGSLATIYVDRVSALAERCGLSVHTLLGRAVAHETGHLLLGSPAHASSGLMRAAWSQDTLRRGGPADWTFTPRDARAMRAAVRRRTAHLMASAALEK